jgi:hypothetical protein
MGDLLRQTMTYAPRFTSFHLSTGGIRKYVNNKRPGKTNLSSLTPWRRQRHEFLTSALEVSGAAEGAPGRH